MAPVWFITAASSGFGHEMTLSALARGHTVIATARNASRIQDLKDAGAETLAFDVTAPQEAQDAIAKDVFARHGRVDYLINAAGYMLDGAVEELTEKEVFDQFNTNVFGLMRTIKAFLPYLREQEVAANGIRSTVASFGSLGSWGGGPTFSVYSMTKWSCSALMESLAAELAPFNIRSTVIEPGYFRTGFLNPGARVLSELRLPAYEDKDTATGKTRSALDATDANQPGDVVKGSKVTVDILTGTGVGEGKDLPVRIVLGPDCDKYIRNKISSTLDILEEWKEVINSTNHTTSE